MTSINFQNSLKRLHSDLRLDLSLVQIQTCNVTLILYQNNTETNEQIFTRRSVAFSIDENIFIFFC